MPGAPIRNLFPETRAGGFTRVDGTIEFYSRVNALLDPEMVVCDLGAGRGGALRDDEVKYRRDLRRLDGKVERVIGIDPDPVVCDHPGLDEARILNEDGTLPLEAASIDLIVSDWVLEHVRDPALFADEVCRVLRPGGWFCARTPNRWHYVPLIARTVPNRLHARVIGLVQEQRKEEDVFPTFYRLNTMREIRKRFPPTRFAHASYYYSAEPTYLPRIRVIWAAAQVVGRITPRWLSQNLFIFLQKRV